MPLRALARFPHFDQLAFAVTRRSGVTALREIFEKKIPLRVSTAPPGDPARWVIGAILKAHGWSLADLEHWGGKVVSEDRQRGRPAGAPAVESIHVTRMVSSARPDRGNIDVNGMVDIAFLQSAVLALGSHSR